MKQLNEVGIESDRLHVSVIPDTHISIKCKC